MPNEVFCSEKLLISQMQEMIVAPSAVQLITRRTQKGQLFKNTAIGKFNSGGFEVAADQFLMLVIEGNNIIHQALVCKLFKKAKLLFEES